MKSFILQSSPASCHFLPLRSKYFPQQPSETLSVTYLVHLLLTNLLLKIQLCYTVKNTFAIAVSERIMRLKPGDLRTELVMRRYSGFKGDVAFCWMFRVSKYVSNKSCRYCMSTLFHAAKMFLYDELLLRRTELEFELNAKQRLYLTDMH
jgi:hypothetical protein